MTRLSRPVAIRAVATFAAAASAFLALAQSSEARMLRDDCFTQIIAACNQNRNVDAAHQCVIHETNSCQETERQPRRYERIDWPRHPPTHVPRLDTLYGGEDTASPEPGGRDDTGNSQGGARR